MSARQAVKPDRLAALPGARRFPHGGAHSVRADEHAPSNCSVLPAAARARTVTPPALACTTSALVSAQLPAPPPPPAAHALQIGAAA